MADGVAGTIQKVERTVAEVVEGAELTNLVCAWAFKGDLTKVSVSKRNRWQFFFLVFQLGDSTRMRGTAKG